MVDHLTDEESCQGGAPADGYWLVADDGAVYPFGIVPYCGSLAAVRLGEGVTGMAPIPAGGYLLVTEHGGLVPFGSAVFDSSLGGSASSCGKVVGVAADTSGGYWIACEWGLFNLGATSLIGAVDLPVLAAPICGLAAMRWRSGLWVATADGGVFCFGNAPFHGSLPGLGLALNGPICGIAGLPDDNGYLLVGEDGGVFSFGTARFLGSLDRARTPVVGVAAHPDGYWLAQRDGTVTAFGDAPDLGGLGGANLSSTVVGIASPAFF